MQVGKALNDPIRGVTALMRVGEHLKKPTRLVLIGSSGGMWYGQPGRMTEDEFNALTFADCLAAVRAANLPPVTRRRHKLRRRPRP